MCKYERLNEELPMQSSAAYTSAVDNLHSWLRIRRVLLPVFHYRITGPDHDRTYWWTCELDHLVTEGRFKVITPRYLKVIIDFFFN
jgi:hypothetical protein